MAATESKVVTEDVKIDLFEDDEFEEFEISEGVSSSNGATFGLGAFQVSSSGMTVILLLVSVAFYLKEIVSTDSHFYNVMAIVSLVGLVVTGELLDDLNYWDALRAAWDRYWGT